MHEAAGIAERNRVELERLQGLVARLSDDDLLRQLPDSEWTVADTLVHLAFYDRRAAILLDQFAREGVSAAPYDFETINQALLPLGRRMPPRAAAEEAVAAARAADRAAEAISDELLAAIRARMEVKPERWEHRQNHLDAIEAAFAGLPEG